MNIDYWEDKVDVFIENEIKLNKGNKNEKVCNTNSRRFNINSNIKRNTSSNK